MKVRLKHDLSGLHDGEPWPGAGETVQVSDAEGAKMIASGIAENASEDHDSVEVPPAGVHTPGATGVTVADTTLAAPADAVVDPQAVPDAVKVDATPTQAAQLAGQPEPDSEPAKPSAEAASKASPPPAKAATSTRATGSRSSAKK